MVSISVLALTGCIPLTMVKISVMIKISRLALAVVKFFIEAMASCIARTIVRILMVEDWSFCFSTGKDLGWGNDWLYHSNNLY